MLNDSSSTRLRFIQNMARATLGLSASFIPAYAKEKNHIPHLAKAHAGSAKHVIYLYMSGGMSHIDTFDMRPENKTIQGPVAPIRTSADGIRISEYLPYTAKQMHHVSIINSMRSTQGVHEKGNYFMHTSYTARGTISHPSLGTWINHFCPAINSTLPQSVVVGGDHTINLNPGFFEAKNAPMPMVTPSSGILAVKGNPNISQSRKKARLEKLQKMNATFMKQNDMKKIKSYDDIYREALKVMSSRDLLAFDINKENPTLRQQYGSTPFGDACMLARRLVEYDTRFIEIDLGGWDSHFENHDEVEENCATLDKGLAALLGDLHSRGLLDETLVVLATEFGRTSKINSRKGRDHQPAAFTTLLAGGGVKGGNIYGKKNNDCDDVIENEVSIPDFNATIGYALGLPQEEIIISPSGRPFTFADKGNPISDLF